MTDWERRDKDIQRRTSLGQALNLYSDSLNASRANIGGVIEVNPKKALSDVMLIYKFVRMCQQQAEKLEENDNNNQSCLPEII